MAKLEMKGMEAYIKQLENVANATKEVCEAAVYAGANVVANEIRTEIRQLKIVSNKGAITAYSAKEPTYISEPQKKGLEESLGVAKIREDKGAYDTKIGFDGYNDVATKRWPNGQPNALIARSCNSGSSAMLKQPFIRRAVAKSRGQALKEMDDAANKKTQEILNK